PQPLFRTKARAIRQQRTIQGKVTDASDNFPLPGVNVMVKDGTAGVSTDLEGNYSISVPDDAEALTFSYVGYVSQEIGIGNQTTINVQLEPDVQSLNQVVVVGYGSQKRVNLT